MTDDPVVVRARLLRALAEAYFGIGDMPASRRGLEDALTCLGLPMPTAPALPPCRVEQDAAKTAIRNWRKPLPGAGARPRRAASRRRASTNGSRTSCLRERLESACSRAPCMPFAVASQELENAPELPRAYANLSLAAAMVPVRPLARLSSGRARSTADQIGDPGVRAWRARNRRRLPRRARGAGTARCSDLETALAAWQKLGDWRR